MVRFLEEQDGVNSLWKIVQTSREQFDLLKDTSVSDSQTTLSLTVTQKLKNSFDSDTSPNLSRTKKRCFNKKNKGLYMSNQQCASLSSKRRETFGQIGWQH